MSIFRRRASKFFAAAALTLAFGIAAAQSLPVVPQPVGVRPYLWLQQMSNNYDPGTVYGGIKNLYVAMTFFPGNVYPARSSATYHPIKTAVSNQGAGDNGHVLTGNSYMNLVQAAETIVSPQLRLGQYLVDNGFDQSAPFNCSRTRDPDSGPDATSGCNLIISNFFPGLAAATTVQLSVIFIDYNNQWHTETIYTHWNANSAKDGYNFSKVRFNPGRVTSWVAQGSYLVAGPGSPTMLYEVPGATE